MKVNRKHFFITIMVTLAALVFLSAYMMTTFYNNARKDALALGESTLAQEKGQAERYLSRAQDIIQMTSMEIEYLLRKDADTNVILDFLKNESDYYMNSVDENFTGVYGWIGGEYLDGIGWVPEAGYVPTERVWYTDAVRADGEPVMIPPYLDAQTGTIMISLSRMLYDGESVISLDISMETLQRLTEQINLNGHGYGFIIEKDGFVVAHSDVTEKGKEYEEDTEKGELVDRIVAADGENFDMVLGGEKITVFSDRISNDWYVAMVVDNRSLYSDLSRIMIQSAFMCLVVFLGIILFCLVEMRRSNLYMIKLQESRRELEQLNETVLQVLARTIDAKDKYTRGHSIRVANYSRELARRMGKGKKEQERIYRAALLHDVGKIRIPDEILGKPGKLTDEEYAYIKLHPVSGYHILKSFSRDQMIATAAKFHHERYDGKGYPGGLAGKNIPEHARIIGVADAYDAMASNRSYRSALPQSVIRSELVAGRGTQFDPEIVGTMLQIMDEDTEYRLRQADDSSKTILVVDDETLSVELVRNILDAQSGYEILTAASGEEALHRLESNKVDLVLLDIEMPGMNGVETLRRIKDHYDVPVVFMTATKELSMVEKARKLGVEDYITKPFMPQILLETVYGALNWEE
ncbi:MAG: response regulator [Acetatifactor sp.]|nr:response regulator [Acetatifactor sp.]